MSGSIDTGAVTLSLEFLSAWSPCDGCELKSMNSREISLEIFSWSYYFLSPDVDPSKIIE